MTDNALIPAPPKKHQFPEYTVYISHEGVMFLPVELACLNA
jgi:hypothetical protein